MSKHPRKPKNQTPAKSRSRQAHQLRIIGGQWRGRKLAIIDAEGLRPTNDRVRETLFNWLAPAISGSTCVDLFAGSGALGLECLSRGALSSTLIENNAIVAKQLTQNCQQLGALNAVVIKASTPDWLAKQKLAKHSIDIAFIDPPFGYNLWDSTIEQLAASGLLAKGALIYVESPRGKVYKIPSEWQNVKNKTAGDVDYALFQCSV